MQHHAKDRSYREDEEQKITRAVSPYVHSNKTEATRPMINKNE